MTYSNRQFVTFPLGHPPFPRRSRERADGRTECPRGTHRPYEESVTNVGQVQTVRPNVCVKLMLDIFDANFS